MGLPGDWGTREQKKGEGEKAPMYVLHSVWNLGFPFFAPPCKTSGFLLDLLLHHCAHFQFLECVEFVVGDAGGTNVVNSLPVWCYFYFYGSLICLLICIEFSKSCSCILYKF